MITGSLWGAALPLPGRARKASASPVGFLLPHGLSPRAPEAIPYVPRPGDIVLYDAYDRFHHFVYALAGTGPPTHAALVIAGDDGRPALLELTGPTVIGAKVVIMDVAERLQSFSGSIWVRRIRRPLNEEQCAALNQFAHAQEGKAFAYRRIALQVTPFRPRTGLRHYCFGHTYLNRHHWICSEMVVAAACAAHVLNPSICTANSMYPRDLAFDEHYDLSERYEPALSWIPTAK
jgi:hypothetical protein